MGQLANKPPLPPDLRRKAELLYSTRPSLPPRSVDEADALLHELQVHQIELELQNEQLRQAQADLEESRDRYAQLYDNAPVGYLTLDRDGAVVACNLAAAELLGRDRSSLLALTFQSLMNREDADAFYLRRLELLRGAGKQSCEVDLERGDGQRLRARLDLVVDADTALGLGCNVALIDVTHERVLEQALRHAQKMEAVGTLASGVAHNVRNVLQAILNSIEVIRMVTPAGEPVVQMIDRATNATKRGSVLIDQLMTFARKQEALGLSPVRLDDVIREAVGLIRPMVSDAISLKIVAGAPGAVVMADPVQLEQILLNLAANARDAMPRGGTFSITSAEADLHWQSARAHGLSPGPHVIVTVADTGEGMDAATKARVFEPFFTTKDIGRGTGLGLSTVFALVQHFNGCIEVDSAPQAGTTFTIWLPALRGPGLDAG